MTFVSDPLILAYRHCETMAKSHYENFPVASLLFPKKLRPHVWAIYAFARSADDFADESYPLKNNYSSLEEWHRAIEAGQSRRLAQLKDWEDQLLSSVQLHFATHPIFIALANTIRVFQLPLQLFQDLLDAFKQDVVCCRYQNFEQLVQYSKRSANPIGRLMLLLFGYSDPQLFELSDELCTGLQLVNFWQDILIDREKNRIYIPQELFERYGLATINLFDSPETVDWHPLLCDLGRTTLEFFKKSYLLPQKVTGRLRYELRLTWLGGMQILQQSCFKPREVLIRPKLSALKKLRLATRTFLGFQSKACSLLKKFQH